MAQGMLHVISGRCFARDLHTMLGVWNVICTRLHPGHLSVRVGDSSSGSQDVVKS